MMESLLNYLASSYCLIAVAFAVVHVSPNSLTVTELSTVTLVCNTTEHSYSVDWSVSTYSQPRQRRIFSTEGVLVSFTERFTVDAQPNVGLYVLKIRDVGLNDSGVYTCKENAGNGPGSDSVTISVFAVTTPSVTSSDVTSTGETLPTPSDGLSLKWIIVIVTISLVAGLCLIAIIWKLSCKPKPSAPPGPLLHDVR